MQVRRCLVRAAFCSGDLQNTTHNDPIILTHYTSSECAGVCRDSCSTICSHGMSCSLCSEQVVDHRSSWLPLELQPQHVSHSVGVGQLVDPALQAGEEDPVAQLIRRHLYLPGRLCGQQRLNSPQSTLRIYLAALALQFLVQTQQNYTSAEHCSVGQ